MKHSHNHRSNAGRRGESGRSGRLSVSPYCVEDCAFTRRELEQARSMIPRTRIVVPG